MADKNIIFDKMADSIISYLEFVKNFKKVKPDEIINLDKFIYIFRHFNVECYIIDKEIFNEFRSAINFDDFIAILDPINDENVKIFKEELKKFLEKNPYIPKRKNIKLYSNEEEIKEIIKNFNNYTFVNKELLVNAMGFPESEIKGNIFNVSRNEKNTCLISYNNNFSMSVVSEKKYENQISHDENEVTEEYKNLYYVEKITEKIFVLLYYNEIDINRKMKKEIKNMYNFKTYYLINNEWLNEYKEFFLYDFIINKMKKYLGNKEYSYNEIKYKLDDIISNGIGQISLYNETKMDKRIRDAKNIIPKIVNISKKKKNIDNIEYKLDYEEETIEYDSIECPESFSIVDKDIFDLLIEEEFFFNLNKEIKDKMKYKILIGDNKITIKNKFYGNNYKYFKYHFEYLFYSYKQISNDYLNIHEYDPFILYYIKIFYDNDSFTTKNNYQNKFFDLNCPYEQNIFDDKRNILGKFININVDETNKKKIFNFEKK